MTINLEVSIGDILTIFSIIVSASALLISWKKDQDLRKKEYADRIRSSAGTIVAKLHRWRELALRFFEDIQPLITESDMLLTKEQNVLSVRDTFWRGMVEIRAKASQRITDEQIEIAYVDLYGYDPRIQSLFSEVIKRFKVIDNSIYTQALYGTQHNILQLQTQHPPYTSAQLGNKLRNTSFLILEDFKQLINEAFEPFTNEMIRLISQKDGSIMNRQIKISSPEDLYSTPINKLQEQLDQRVTEILSRSAHINPLVSETQNQSRDWLGAPLITANGNLIGVISIDSNHHETFLNEKKVVDLLAEQASKSISSRGGKKTDIRVNKKAITKKNKS